jgi:hypothetical protein
MKIKLYEQEFDIDESVFDTPEKLEAEKNRLAKIAAKKMVQKMQEDANLTKDKGEELTEGEKALKKKWDEDTPEFNVYDPEKGI